MNEPVSRLAGMLSGLKPKTKTPASATVLTNWITKAASDLGPEAGGGRLAWLVASSVAVAAVQRAVDAQGNRLFLLKGGNLLQHRLPGASRPTKDVDGIVRGDLDAFLLALEDALAEPWGPLTLRRGPVETVDVPTKVVKPRRFDIILELRGAVWRRIQFEASPDEAGIAEQPEPIQPPPLAAFGLPDPDTLVGIALRNQVAQKLHAASDPHDPPRFKNDRARDVPDLILIKQLADETGQPTLWELRQAAEALFAARAAEAAQCGYPGRAWPCQITAHPHWPADYRRAAESAGITLAPDQAVELVNQWIAQIAAAVNAQRYDR